MQQNLHIIAVYSCCYATTQRWVDIPGPFLGNGSVNEFSLLGSRFLVRQQLDYSNVRFGARSGREDSREQTIHREQFDHSLPPTAQT
jgi:hypothetical protein